jgi:hypothetical protein
MKIIDQTPYFNHETGKISLIDRGRAMMEYGASWIKEVEGQQEIIAVLGKVLDRNFTLLRNVTPAGLGTRFPLILIGPAGVYVMFVTAMTGIFRAKGDQWGTITGSTFKIEEPNLLTRTERMARAIQVFLQRQGYTAMINVDPVLLCSDPSFNVDSIRPIIRVVMRDAVERFAISLAQGRGSLSPEAIQDIAQRILNPPKPEPPAPTEILTAASPDGPDFAQAEVASAAAFDTPESKPPLWSDESAPAPVPVPVYEGQAPARKRLTKMQWAFLIVIFVVWVFLILAFVFLVLQTLGILS